MQVGKEWEIREELGEWLNMINVVWVNIIKCKILKNEYNFFFKKEKEISTKLITRG